MVLIFERERRIQDAESEYRQAVNCDPNDRQAHFNFGRILVNEKKYKEAIEQLSQTISPDDESAPAYLYALGAAYGRAGDRSHALLYLREAREKASARGQEELLVNIENDLHSVEGQTPKN